LKKKRGKKKKRLQISLLSAKEKENQKLFSGKNKQAKIYAARKKLHKKEIDDSSEEDVWLQIFNCKRKKIMSLEIKCEYHQCQLRQSAVINIGARFTVSN